MWERLLGAVLVLALVAGTAIGPGVAGDDSILLYPGEEQRTVEQGEEIDIELVVSHHGGPYGEGLERVTVVGEYEPSHLRISDISTAGWFETDETGEVMSTTDTSQTGQFNVSQHVDTDGGVVGTALFATLTVEISEDAPTGTTTLELGNSSVSLAGGFPQPLFETNPEIIIEESDGGATADGDDESAGENDGADSGTEESAGSDETGAFPVPVAVTAGLLSVAAAVTVGVYRHLLT